jgi:OPT family oligopeptide transporter
MAISKHPRSDFAAFVCIHLHSLYFMPKFSFLGMQRMSAETVGCFSDVPTTERNAGKLQEVHNSEEVLDEEVSSSSPIIEEVAFTVATVDDPTLACLTFRTVVLGVGGNMLLTIVNTFFGYRKEPLHISAISIQIVVLPLGHLMAKLLPRKSIQLVLPGLITNRDGRRWWSWGFSLNPGPFTMKEHVLITVFANTGGGAAATIVVNVVKAFYKQRMDFMPSLIFVVATQVRSSKKTLLLLHESLPSFMLLLKLSSLSFDLKLQLLGYGFAGLYRKVLVEPAHMWWPHTLVQVSLFRYFSLFRPAACCSSMFVFSLVYNTALASCLTKSQYPKLLNPSHKTQDVL